MNAVVSPPPLVSIAKYAQSLLTSFETPIASDRLDALVYMMVGSARVRTLSDLTTRMKRFFAIGKNSPHPGIFWEAVLGEFGAGKSHIGYMLKHNALTMGNNVLVAHVQITGEADFNATLAALLRNLRLSGASSVQAYGVDLGAYAQIFRWCGGSAQQVQLLCQSAVGNLPPAVGNDFALAVIEAGTGKGQSGSLQRFIEAWVMRTQPKEALETFELVMRVFARLKVRRLALIIDEFEAMQSLQEQHRLQVLQGFQDLHDDFAGRMPDLPSTYLVAFSTRDWWERAGNILPSLIAANQRVKVVTPIPDVDDMDIVALFYRYLGLYTMSRAIDVHPSREAVDHEVAQIVSDSAGTMHHMRSIHARVRQRVEHVLGI